MKTYFKIILAAMAVMTAASCRKTNPFNEDKKNLPGLDFEITIDDIQPGKDSLYHFMARTSDGETNCAAFTMVRTEGSDKIFTFPEDVVDLYVTPYNTIALETTAEVNAWSGNENVNVKVIDNRHFKLEYVSDGQCVISLFNGKGGGEVKKTVLVTAAKSVKPTQVMVRFDGREIKSLVPFDEDVLTIHQVGIRDLMGTSRWSARNYPNVQGNIKTLEPIHGWARYGEMSEKFGKEHSYALKYGQLVQRLEKPEDYFVDPIDGTKTEWCDLPDWIVGCLGPGIVVENGYTYPPEYPHGIRDPKYPDGFGASIDYNIAMFEEYEAEDIWNMEWATVIELLGLEPRGATPDYAVRRLADPITWQHSFAMKSVNYDRYNRRKNPNYRWFAPEGGQDWRACIRYKGRNDKFIPEGPDGQKMSDLYDGKYLKGDIVYPADLRYRQAIIWAKTNPGKTYDPNQQYLGYEITGPDTHDVFWGFWGTYYDGEYDTTEKARW